MLISQHFTTNSQINFYFFFYKKRQYGLLIWNCAIESIFGSGPPKNSRGDQSIHQKQKHKYKKKEKYGFPGEYAVFKDGKAVGLSTELEAVKADGLNMFLSHFEEFSKYIPDMLFIFRIEGEAPDLVRGYSKAYIQNGKSVECKAKSTWVQHEAFIPDHLKGGSYEKEYTLDPHMEVIYTLLTPLDENQIKRAKTYIKKTKLDEESLFYELAHSDQTKLGLEEYDEERTESKSDFISTMKCFSLSFPKTLFILKCSILSNKYIPNDLIYIQNGGLLVCKGRRYYKYATFLPQKMDS